MIELLNKSGPLLTLIGCIITVIVGYVKMGRSVDELEKDFNKFIDVTFKEFREKQDKYVQEHYSRINRLEIDYVKMDSIQTQINKRMEEQYMDIKRELHEIKMMMGARREKDIGE